MGVTGMVVIRADSAFFSHKVVAACRRAKARFSMTVAQRKEIRELITTIPEDAWTAIKYPKAIRDKAEEDSALGHRCGPAPSVANSWPSRHA